MENMIMNITFVVPHMEISGGIRIALMYAHFLSLRGHTVTVVSTSNNIRKKIKNIGERKSGSIKEFVDGKPYWFRNLDARVVRAACISDDTVPDADIIVAANYKKAEEIHSLSARKGVPFELIMHDERLYHGDAEEVARVYQKPLRKICISNWLRERIQEDFSQESDVLVTPVDTDLFFPEQTRCFRDDGIIRVALLHHNFAWKGTEVGVRVFRAVQDRTKRTMHLALLGARFKHVEKQHDLYYYDPPQEQLRRIYSNADIFLCPSEWEGLGMPAMEAMACNTAVVTFDTGGSRDYAFDGKTAFVARHADEAHLEEKLEEAVNNDERRERIAEEGRRLVTTELDSWTESVKKLECIFKREQVI